MDLTGHLHPGDTVVVGQAVAEPPALVEALIDAARTVPDVTALCGYVVGDGWSRATPGRPRILGLVAAGPLRRLEPGVLDYYPAHLSRVEEHIRAGRLAVDVVLLQVGPPDEHGDHDLGPCVDHAVVAAERARTVLVEVHEDMPRTRSTRRLPRSLVTAAIPATRPLPASPARPPSDLERAVAAQVAGLVPDGAAIQMGLGTLPDAVAAALAGRRDLRVRSGLVGDWLVTLQREGALADGPDAVVTGMALGSAELYAHLDAAGHVTVAAGGGHDVIGPSDGPLVAVNSAVEVDLLGQVGAEIAGGRLVGGVGGQADWFRAVHRAGAGAAVIALPSVTATGASRIVARLDGPVTTSKSDVDVVVTEWGVADLRACSVRQRVERLVAIAHPDHREVLGTTAVP